MHEGNSPLEGIRAAADGRTGAISHASPEPDIAQLRHARELLLHEREQIGYWRRLIRARIDITMAGILAPDPLGFGSASGRRDPDVPTFRELTDLISQEAGLRIDALDRYREVDEQLIRYAQRIERELEAVMSAMVELRMDSLRSSFDSR